MIASMIGQADTTNVPGPAPEKRFALAMAHLSEWPPSGI